MNVETFNCSPPSARKRFRTTAGSIASDSLTARARGKSRKAWHGLFEPRSCMHRGNFRCRAIGLRPSIFFSGGVKRRIICLMRKRWSWGSRVSGLGLLASACDVIGWLVSRRWYFVTKKKNGVDANTMWLQLLFSLERSWQEARGIMVWALWKYARGAHAIRKGYFQSFLPPSGFNSEGEKGITFQRRQGEFVRFDAPILVCIGRVYWC